MNKKKLQAAIAPFPIKQSDKERFVNTITEMSSSGGSGVEYEYYSFYGFVNMLRTLSDEEFTKLYGKWMDVCYFILSFNIIPISFISDIHNKSFFIQFNVLDYFRVAGFNSTLPIISFKIEKQNIRIVPDLYYREASRKVQYKGDIISNKNTFKEQFIEIVNKRFGENTIDIDFINNYMTSITKEEYESLIGQEVPA